MSKVENECCLPLDHGQVELDLEKLASICKAMGHPVRLQILKHLISKGVCISGDLTELLPLAASTVSEHLRILKVAGLVQGTVDGPRRNYCVDEQVLKSFKSVIQNL